MASVFMMLICIVEEPLFISTRSENVHNISELLVQWGSSMDYIRSLTPPTYFKRDPDLKLKHEFKL